MRIVFVGLLVFLTSCSMMQMPRPPEMSAADYMKTLELNNAAGCSVVTFRGAATPYADVVAKVATINVFGKNPPDLALCLGTLPGPAERGSVVVPRGQVQPDSPADMLMKLIDGMR